MVDKMDTLAKNVITSYKNLGWKITTAESCTGGGIFYTLTSVDGSSAVMDRGFVTYATSSKTDMVGVPADLIESFGVVSKEVAEAMAKGALEHTPESTNVAVAVTGYAGTAPDSTQSGLVYIGLGFRDTAGDITVQHEECRFHGERNTIREDVIKRALERLLGLAEKANRSELKH